MNVMLTQKSMADIMLSDGMLHADVLLWEYCEYLIDQLLDLQSYCVSEIEIEN